MAESAPPAARSRRRGIHSLRRVFQIAFLLAFFALLTLTVWPLGQVYLGVFLVGDPLIALNTLLNGAWLPPMVIALLMLAVPLVLGRAFCGYVCPMGTVVELTAPKPSRGSRLSDRTRGWLRKLPPFTLVFALGLSLFASGAILVFDPLSMLTRTATTLLYPFLDRVVRLVGDVAYLAPPLRGSVDTVTSLLTGRLVFAAPLTFGLTMLTLALFAGVLLASRLETRLWCRHLCPLGALLGQVGRFGFFGRKVDESACTSCGKCAKVCPLDAVGPDMHSTDATRCQLGLECADECPEGAIGVGWRPRKVAYVPGRRAFVGATGGALLLGFFNYTGLSRQARDPKLVRPPGSQAESDFLGLCSRCGQCMKVCPTNVLQPSLDKAGIEGVFTPEMNFSLGFCDWACNECGKVCPTGAIEALTLPAKRATVIGRAYIDENRCIPYADYETCLVCEELCPIPDKAIVLEEVTLQPPEGKEITLGQPKVIEERCIGCGICENKCPAQGRAAILVQSRES